MKYSLLILITVISVVYCIERDEVDIPQNLYLPAHQVELHRGFVVVNDTLFVGSGYYLLSDSIDVKEASIYGSFFVGDSLITDHTPSSYIIRARKEKRDTFWRSTYIDQHHQSVFYYEN